MKRSVCLLLALLGLSGARLSAAAFTDQEVLPIGGRLTLECAGLPLSQIIEKAAPQDARFTVAPELKELKATVIVRDQPAAVVLERLASHFGAEWRQVETPAGPRYELRRRKDVAEWETAWRRARLRAEQAAREFQEREILALLERTMSAVDAPLPLDENGMEKAPEYVNDVWPARFVRSLSPRELGLVVRQIAAASPVRSGGQAGGIVPPILIPFKNSSRRQQDYVRNWIQQSYRDAKSATRLAQIQSELPDSMIAVGSQDGVVIDVTLILPKGGRVVGHAGGSAWPGERLESEVQAALLREMGKQPTPRHALLGASITRGDEIEPRVGTTMQEDRAAGPPDRLLGQELLAWLAAERGLNVIADHHTRSARLAGPRGAPMKTLLEQAAEQFQWVMRLEGGFLQARNCFWPDRDEEETPYPHVEGWVAAKRAGEEMTLQDYARIALLSQPRLDGLRAYKDGGPTFKRDISVATANRWVLTTVDALSEKDRRQAEAKQGLRLQDLSLRMRTFVAGGLAGQQVPLTRDLRLFIHFPAAKGTGPPATRTIYFAEPGASIAAWGLVFQR